MSNGWLILGMHRSGTSALSRVLSLCGADAGGRVLGASAGNEVGHWEDAFAVEVHERLLAGLGLRWNDPFALPVGWREHGAAVEAKSAIRRYMAGDRRRHPLWILKDPRTCLFAPLWQDAAASEGVVLSSVVMLRHPLEVASSLEIRDGLSRGRALALWLDYTLAAAEAAVIGPNAVVTYDMLLDDWLSVVGRLASLPGGRELDCACQPEAVEVFLDAGRRHHRAESADDLPVILGGFWRQLCDRIKAGRLTPQAVRNWRRTVGPAVELVREMYSDWHQRERSLWERVSLAESTLAAGTSELRSIPADVLGLRHSIEAHHSSLISAITQDIQRMQGQLSQALESASAREAEASLARELSPRLGALVEGVEQSRVALVDAITQDIRRMQEQVADAQRAIGAAEARAERSHELERRIESLLRTEEQSNAKTVALQESVAAKDAELDRLLSERNDLVGRLMALDYEVRRLKEVEREFALVRASRSWRWTRPLRAALRLFGGRWSENDRAALAARVRVAFSWLPGLGGRAGGRSTRSPATPSGVPRTTSSPHQSLIAQEPGVADVFVWSVIDWHFRFQRPQHLAKAMAAKGHRVFYISNNFVDAEEPGFRVDALDESGRLFQVHLHLAGAPAIYFGLPAEKQVAQLRASLAELLAWSCTSSSISLVQHPYWSRLLRSVPNARVVYDCIDHHRGFENNAPTILQAEDALSRDADLVIVTSDWLRDEIAPKAKTIAMIRNAGEYDFFCRRPQHVFRDPLGRRVIGYYGAIAEWFDVDLVRQVALAYPECLVLLVGNDTAGAGEALRGQPNVRLTGEMPYTDLPYWLHGFDVCLLPFRVIPLTLATNPVKVYEYLASGKPVVAVDLPEMAQFGGLVSVGKDADAFVAAVGHVLSSLGDAFAERARKVFAAGQTWSHRAEDLDSAISALVEPLVSVVVLTYNNLAFTEACLFSLEAYSDYSNLEIIVVDNASTDASCGWLHRWVKEASPAGHRRRLILNESNLGFSAGNNVGLRAASGDFLVILNNDTYVTPGWVRTLTAHLRQDHGLGLVGPVTNNIGNEARIEITYADMAEMICEAGRYTRKHPGMLRPMRIAAFFCVAMRRSTFDIVGEMDEAFGVGFFEDDDYCRRVEQAGLSIACAEDVFVHHHLSASFDALKAGQKQALFERNKAIYEAKWGAWQPHTYRQEGAE